VLVPEISLTPQTVSRFRAHFGDEVAVLHSGLSDGERYDAWRSLRDGERKVAVGARSALFAPLERLGAVVVDEEHDGSYKQSEAPRYQARDLAVMRARAHGAVCVLGSATPSLESRHNVDAGKFERLELPERAWARRSPRSGWSTSGPPGSSGGAGRESGAPAQSVFSPELIDASGRGSGAGSRSSSSSTAADTRRSCSAARAARSSSARTAASRSPSTA
jgi:primosomal protein N' (replication factor Y) (superfamily II helicase)